MSDDALIEKFARDLCKQHGHDPDALMFEFPQVPYIIKGRRYAFMPNTLAAVATWQVFLPEARIMAAVVRGEAVI